MMTVLLSAENGTAVLDCEFCGQRHGWPLPVRVWWERTSVAGISDPNYERVIRSHFVGNPQSFFPECSNVAAWRTTAWTVFDADQETTFARGELLIAGGQLYFNLDPVTSN